jgi:hypothetical protein
LTNIAGKTRGTLLEIQRRPPAKTLLSYRSVTLKGGNITTSAADFMDAAKALKTHDIINVRIDTEENSGGSGLGMVV